MTSKHMLEPWAYFEPAEADMMTEGYEAHRAFRIFSKGEAGKRGCTCIGALVPGHLNDKAPRVADVQRIVACVNGCEGLADPSVVPELLEALLAFQREHEDGNWTWNTRADHVPESPKLIRAVLAKARGGNHD